MKYYQFSFRIHNDNADLSQEIVADVLSSLLAEIGFESFVHSRDLNMVKVTDPHNPESATFEYADDAESDEYSAYIQQSLFDEDALKAVVENVPLPGVVVTYSQSEPEDKDWNAEWEQNYFQPICVESQGHTCSIASTFHRDVPPAEYAIVIDPRMSFGTGHHQTTSQMISRLLEMDITGKEVLDMGCGTSILAILARMRGAAHCWAIDVDEWCVDNSRDNIALNGLNGIDVVLGSAASLSDGTVTEQFDMVIANINRNILLQDMNAYVASMRPGADILMSGFYTEDVALIVEKGESLGLRLVDVRSLDNWACVRLSK